MHLFTTIINELYQDALVFLHRFRIKLDDEIIPGRIRKNPDIHFVGIPGLDIIIFRTDTSGRIYRICITQDFASLRSQ
jgi:hypothetical protein